MALVVRPRPSGHSRIDPLAIQAHKPTPPVTTGKNSALPNAAGGGSDADKARKHGMEEYIAADPITFDHHCLFSNLQTSSLEWRLKDPFASLGPCDTPVATRDSLY